MSFPAQLGMLGHFSLFNLSPVSASAFSCPETGLSSWFRRADDRSCDGVGWALALSLGFVIRASWTVDGIVYLWSLAA